MSSPYFTPREIVGELDRYIVGQQKAKRAVAVALRNRYRRQRVEGDLRDEISPKNIIMEGPTGVGKTEIARRLAKLAKAPFVKVEASKFTEVGYVGRDVESIIRDLVDTAINLVRDEEIEAVKHRAEEQAEERLARILVERDLPEPEPTPEPERPVQGPAAIFGPFLMNQGATESKRPRASQSQIVEMRDRIRRGEMDEELVELEVKDSSNPFMTIFGAHGMEEMEFNLRDMLGNLPGGKGRTKKRRVKVPEALEILAAQEAERLVDQDRVQREALKRAQESGIVFLDEIDKIGGREGFQGADVSREGVQRDLLPIIEGSTVNTKYGPVKTDHILFIAAGAFHVSKLSDLIPELQGRFPIRVTLDSLEAEDFKLILTEPRNALTKQYVALMATEGIDLKFTEDGVEAIARYAAEANRQAENIGARRLHTILEALLEELSFTAPERTEREFIVDAAYVEKTIEPIVSSAELSKFIL
ncbi:MAG: ATP-dependent protease ATPase subunit HslU [Sandaracinaceae bacterium]|nr:ATP-dependent protease ATPase subunit HslU [Sandaracinaceae bacterium]